MRALPGRRLPDAPPEAKAEPAAPRRPAAPVQTKSVPPVRKPSASLHGIEPNRERRIALGREPIGARLDLHGLSQDEARAALIAFLKRAHVEGQRAVLVITGQGRVGGGILRRRLPDWLAEAAVREMVAGVSVARRSHGGEGAFYVALKRRPAV